MAGMNGKSATAARIKSAASVNLWTGTESSGGLLIGWICIYQPGVYHSFLFAVWLMQTIATKSIFFQVVHHKNHAFCACLIKTIPNLSKRDRCAPRFQHLGVYKGTEKSLMNQKWLMHICEKWRGAANEMKKVYGSLRDLAHLEVQCQANQSKNSSTSISLGFSAYGACSKKGCTSAQANVGHTYLRQTLHARTQLSLRVQYCPW